MIAEPLQWGPRDYVQLPCVIPDTWKVIDIGPGGYPFLRANLFVDRDPAMLRPLEAMGKATFQSNIGDGFPGIGNKTFDYAWCSHVLEHVDDPVACAAAISRIAKAGTIVMPSAVKDSLFLFEEREHKWHVLPNPKTGKPPIFVRHNRDFIYPLEDELVQQAMCFLFRTGSNHECTAERHLRTWYQTHEQHLDIVYHWTGTLELIVLA